MPFSLAQKKQVEKMMKKSGFIGNAFRENKTGDFSYTSKGSSFAKSKVAVGYGEFTPPNMVFDIKNNSFKQDKRIQNLNNYINKVNKRKPEISFKPKQEVEKVVDAPKYAYITGKLRREYVAVQYVGGKRREKKWFDVSNISRRVKIGSGVDWKKRALEKFDNSVTNDAATGEPSFMELASASVSGAKVNISGAYQNIGNIKLKNYMIDLDGMPKNDSWDTKNGTCVTDFISWYYENDNEIDKTCINPFFFTHMFERPLEDGLSINDIRHWCVFNDVNMIALDKDKNLLVKHQCERGKKKKSLIFIAHNEHIYPFIERSQINSISKIHGNIKVNSTSRKIKHEKKEFDGKIEIITSIDRECTPLEFMCKRMMDSGIEIQNYNIRWGKDGLQSFICNETDIKTIFNDKSAEIYREYIENEGKKYNGERPSELIYSAIEKYELEFSEPNGILNNLFGLDHIKDMIHSGFYGSHNLNSLSRSDLKSYDIKRCFTSVMENPIEEWYMYDFNSQVDDFNGKLEPGLYFVETTDTKLFCGNKLYSMPVVKLGLKDGLIKTEDIKKFIKPSHVLEKDTYSIFLDRLVSDLNPKNDKFDDIVKIVCNSVAGILGKTKQHIYDKKISTSKDETWNYMSSKDKESLFYNTHTIDGVDFYIYGDKNDILKDRHNIAHYIQIVSEQCIKMYKAAKSMTDGDWSRLVHRKCDAITIIGKPSSNKYIKNEVGYFREQEPPTTSITWKYKDMIVNWDLYKNNWKMDRNFKTSKDYEKVFEYIDKGKSLCIQAEAGLGKSYIISKIVEKYGEDKVLRIAFTNCAARRIGGQTIHSTFRCINDDGRKKVSQRLLKEFKDYSCVCVDEQGTIGSDLWRILYDVKEHLKVPFISVGDFHQIKPIEGIRFNNHEVIKFICDYNLCELGWHDKCRQTKETYDICQVIRHGTKKEIRKILSKLKHIDRDQLSGFNIHICYTNKTRTSINDIISDEIGDQKLKMGWPDLEECNKVWHTDFPEEMCDIYEGIPIICKKNNYEQEWFNGERYRIDKIREVEVDEDPEDLEYHIFHGGETKAELRQLFVKYHMSGYEIQISPVGGGDVKILSPAEFLWHFDICYAMTNHKIIGETINVEDYVIHETSHSCADRSWIYTAVSRARDISQVHLYLEQIELQEPVQPSKSAKKL